MDICTDYFITSASAAVVVRSVYLPRFRNPDFLFATLDIAIWSTVEQGLAISAGSLATLRPLLRVVGWKLGLAGRSSGQGRSNYGELEGSQSRHLSSRLHNSQTRAGDATITSLYEDKKAAQSANGYRTTYEVRIEADSMQAEAELSNLSHVIAHGKTYEISSEYISGSPTDVKKWQSGSKGRPEVSSRAESTESTKRLRAESSRGTEDEHHSPV